MRLNPSCSDTCRMRPDNYPYSVGYLLRNRLHLLKNEHVCAKLLRSKGERFKGINNNLVLVRL